VRDGCGVVWHGDQSLGVGLDVQGIAKEDRRKILGCKMNMGIASGSSAHPSPTQENTSKKREEKRVTQSASAVSCHC
jgi:hypothetical protein